MMGLGPICCSRSSKRTESTVFEWVLTFIFSLSPLLIMDILMTSLTGMLGGMSKHIGT
ncbi:hypothetical protein CONLIGDRAFT_482309 [Coniochaeta ligniaria NRRL 30616]|uniref:Uncharacterized protein n=1 Tax=Coniochaeta ligniaria NRRL 30616 TaxID=1408157 RepID=A0A1J7JA25_9PEZI|nr:hypothetical protein CONLIGDRAFT_482309 [Coniochaeta ligniaria NRRL 30616]